MSPDARGFLGKTLLRPKAFYKISLPAADVKTLPNKRWGISRLVIRQFSQLGMDLIVV
jgi:hypothetical protein